MNRKLLPAIIVMLFLLLGSGCGGKMSEATTPADNAPEPQPITPTNIDKVAAVEIGPAVQEYYDPNQPEAKIVMVYVNTNAESNYHRVGCKYITKGPIALSLDEAKEEGYTPCPFCRPPQ